KLIWNATEKSVSSVIFNGETVTVLSQARSRSIIVDLDEPDSVIIKGETYKKLNEKKLSKVSIDDDSQPFRNQNDNHAQQKESDNETSSQIDELEDEIMSNKKKNKQNSNSYKRIDVLSEDEIMLDVSSPSANEDEISNVSIPADQNDYSRVIIYPHEISNIDTEEQHSPNNYGNNHQLIEENDGNTLLERIVVDDELRAERTHEISSKIVENIEEIDKPPLQNSKKKQIEDEMLNEESFISDDDEVDNVSSLLNTSGQVYTLAGDQGSDEEIEEVTANKIE
ncbi:25259_t:CDS:10, partial [Dentiscutata erythropus]